MAVERGVLLGRRPVPCREQQWAWALLDGPVVRLLKGKANCVYSTWHGHCLLGIAFKPGSC